MEIVKIENAPMGHIVDLFGKKFLVDSREVGYGKFETMVFATEGKKSWVHKYQGYSWNWADPILEITYRNEYEMVKMHKHILDHFEEMIW